MPGFYAACVCVDKKWSIFILCMDEKSASAGWAYVDVKDDAVYVQ
jgi:hypothetical protein